MPEKVGFTGGLGAQAARYQTLSAQFEQKFLSGPLPGWKEIKNPDKVPSGWQMFKAALVDAGLASKTGMFKQSFDVREQYKVNIQALQAGFVTRLKERGVEDGNHTALAKQLIPYSFFKSPDAGAVARKLTELETSQAKNLVGKKVSDAVCRHRVFSALHRVEKIDNKETETQASLDVKKSLGEAAIAYALKQPSGSISENLDIAMQKMLGTVNPGVVNRYEMEQNENIANGCLNAALNLFNKELESFLHASDQVPQELPSLSALFEARVNSDISPGLTEQLESGAKSFLKSLFR